MPRQAKTALIVRVTCSQTHTSPIINHYSIGKYRQHIHLADKPILIHSLALPTLGLFRPHLLHVLKDHVAVAVERLDARQELAVVPARNEDLGV